MIVSCVRFESQRAWVISEYSLKLMLQQKSLASMKSELQIIFNINMSHDSIY